MSGLKFLGCVVAGAMVFFLALPWLIGGYVHYVKWVVDLFHQLS